MSNDEMSDDDLVKSLIAAEPDFSVGAGDALTRRGLEDAWHAGQVLLVARQRLGPGWWGWLETSTNILVSRAEALVRLADMYPDGVEDLDQELAISALYMMTPG